MKRRPLWLCLLFCGALVALFASSATASSRHPRGDAEAVLRALGNGGWAARLGGHTVTAAPMDFLPDVEVSIRPFSGTPFDGRHYCALDWHAIAFSYIDGGDRSYKQQQFTSVINQVSVVFTLDGLPLATKSGATQRFLNPQGFGIEVGYYRQFGRAMAPTDLAVGAHSLSINVVDPTYGDFSDSITFVIDAAGTGTCL